MAVVHWQKLFFHCMRIVSWNMAKQMCESRTATMQKTKSILNSLAAAIHENKRCAVANSENIVHPSSTSLYGE